MVTPKLSAHPRGGRGSLLCWEIGDIEQGQEKYEGEAGGLQQIWLSVSFTLKSKFLSTAWDTLPGEQGESGLSRFSQPSALHPGPPLGPEAPGEEKKGDLSGSSPVASGLAGGTILWRKFREIKRSVFAVTAHARVHSWISTCPLATHAQRPGQPHEIPDVETGPGR